MIPSNLATNFDLLTLSKIGQNLLNIFLIQILINFLIIYLHHRSIDTSTKTLNFLKSKHFIFGSLSEFNPKFLFDCMNNLLSSSDHTRSSATYLKMKLSDFLSVKHSIKTCYFINLHVRHVKNLSYFVHRRNW